MVVNTLLDFAIGATYYLIMPFMSLGMICVIIRVVQVFKNIGDRYNTRLAVVTISSFVIALILVLIHMQLVNIIIA